jgi:hypothetical protein
MKILEANKDALLSITLPSGEQVPEHFHVTEVGSIHKRFIDCGGTVRESFSCLMQAWTADDVEHRLNAGKLLKIFTAADGVLSQEDWVASQLPIEIEYGADAATQYMLDNVRVAEQGLSFVLKGKKTDCLAPDKCGIKLKSSYGNVIELNDECCGGGCCC